ncbi:MAG: HD domain-containing phosphohydrolase [Syntrophobacter sp.]
MRKNGFERLFPGLLSPKDSDEVEEAYYPISPFMVFPEAYGEFRVYLKRGKHYFLLTCQADQFNQKQKEVLSENGIQEVYIHISEKNNYEEYLRDNLAEILLNGDIPLQVRSNALYHASSIIVRDVFDKTKVLLDMQSLDQLTQIVRSSMGFFASKEALRSIGAIVSPDLTVASHCVRVFLYSAAIFSRFDAPEEERIQFGLGALLHDLGKTTIPKMVLYKRGKLNSEERILVKQHPQRGVGMASQVPLGQITINTILFHHERGDGSGYPAGLIASSIPMHARIISVADSYDTLAAGRPFVEPLPPARALAVMRENFPGFYDPQILNMLNYFLAQAGVI